MEAAQAVLKTDGLQVGDHTISVAISNPPDRKAPLKTRTEAFVPSLGGGKKESEMSVFQSLSLLNKLLKGYKVVMLANMSWGE